MKNLNELEISVDYPNVNPSLQDFSVSSADNNVQVYFKNIELHLLRHIEAADIVVGCVAWLTSKAILHALEKKKGVSIIVQKEDWLRPDINDNGSWKSKRRALYEQLPSALSRYDEGLQGTVVSMMSYAGDPTIEAVRCVGNHNSQRVPAFPRMHHKFIVLCREISGEDGYRNYEPYEVWTGSFNFTKNAGFSFENAIVLKDAGIVRAFFREYAQIAALSEPLNWEAEWVAPEWRVGS
jgi:phosphatidylserine/phosphatidylglycerophosphate/cardiolipin synthase-like enzyme